MAETKLDKSVTKPSTTQPGDGPADTVDPTEVAHSATPRPDAEAIKVGTVNAVVPGTPITETAKVPEKNQRIEEYEATRPDGSKVKVKHNIDTGTTELV